MDMRFNIYSYVLFGPSSVSNLIGEFIVAERVNRNYPISLFHRATHVDLVEFDIILDMY